MKKQAQWLCVALTMMLMFSSCSIQHRRYNKGFYVDWFSKPDNKKTAEALPDDVGLSQNNQIGQIALKPKQNLQLSKTVPIVAPNIVQHLNTGLKEVVVEKPSHDLKTTDTTKCDVIIPGAGDLIEAKVLDIGDGLIRYKLCNDLDGPIMVKNLDEVMMIKYADGTIYKKEQKVQQTVITSNKGNWQSTVSLVCGILGIFFVFPSIFAIIFGAIALNKIKKYNPSKKSWKARAIWGLVLGIIVFALFVLSVFALVALFL